MIRRLAALLLLVSAAPAQAADTEIAETTTSQVVAAHGGRLAWSDGDRLMTWANGVASQVPVEAQDGGFDVSLGRGPGGGTVAVYSRDDGLYLFDFAKGTETRQARLSKARVREQGPVIDRELVVFFRGSATRRGLYVGSLRNGTTRRIPKLPRDIGPYDFQGRRLAYTQGEFDGERSIDRLYVHDVVTGRRRAVARVTSGALSSARFAGTTLQGRFLYAVKVRRGAEGNRFLKIELGTWRFREAIGRRGIAEAAFDRGRAFYLAGGEDECAPCRLMLTPPVF